MNFNWATLEECKIEGHDLFGYVGPDNSTLHLYREFAMQRKDGVWCWDHVARGEDQMSALADATCSAQKELSHVQ